MDYRGENLIFLISQPRAGSTLLQRILAGNSKVHTIAESWIMLHPLYALKKNGITAEFEFKYARQGLEDFLSQVPEDQELYFQALRQMGKKLYNRVLEESGKRLFLDKTPRYYLIIAELKNVFPEAKFIILLRHPLAVLSSILNTWFKNDPLALQKSANYIDIIKGPQYLIQGIQHLKEDAIVVRYEDLVVHTEFEIKKICNRLSISFESPMLNYGEKAKPKGRLGDTVGILKHNYAVPDYTEKWCNKLQSRKLNRFSRKYMETLGDEVFTQMGYSYVETLNQLKKAKFGYRYREKLSKLRPMVFFK
ncbi:MAG: sulfotransferase [Desulfobacterales bacterium]